MAPSPILTFFLCRPRLIPSRIPLLNLHHDRPPTPNSLNPPNHPPRTPPPNHLPPSHHLIPPTRPHQHRPLQLLRPPRLHNLQHPHRATLRSRIYPTLIKPHLRLARPQTSPHSHARGFPVLSPSGGMSCCASRTESILSRALLLSATWDCFIYRQPRFLRAREEQLIHNFTFSSINARPTIPPLLGEIQLRDPNQI